MQKKENLIFKINEIIIRIIKNIYEYVMVRHSQFDFSKKTYVFDIDDSENIVGIIKEASNNNHNLLLFIDTDGGDLDASNAICAALRTFHDFSESKYYKQNRSRITCVIENKAHSAGSMIALSGNEICMDGFASLSPVDPQIPVNTNDKYFDYVSSQLYSELNDLVTKKVLNVETDKFLLMKRECNIYNDNIENFKLLLQYQILNNATKQQRLLNTFCKNIVPHNKLFTVHDLRNLGLVIFPVTDDQRNILNLLHEYRDNYEYII
jgi:ClpP class serine protease